MTPAAQPRYDVLLAPWRSRLSLLEREFPLRRIDGCGQEESSRATGFNDKGVATFAPQAERER